MLAAYDGTATTGPGAVMLRDSAQYASIESDLVLIGLAGLQVRAQR